MEFDIVSRSINLKFESARQVGKKEPILLLKIESFLKKRVQSEPKQYHIFSKMWY